MISNFLKLHDSLNDETIRVVNDQMNNVLKSYSFFYISNAIDIDQNQEICQNINKSKLIVIDNFKESSQAKEDLHFILGFEKTIIIIKQDSISFLNSLFLLNNKLKIFFLSDIKPLFDQLAQINYQVYEIDNVNNFEYEKENFNHEIRLKNPKKGIFNDIWEIIKSIISSYLIQKSYIKLNKNRVKLFYSKKQEEYKILNKEEYIELRNIEIGSCSSISLIYHIEKENLLAIKRLNTLDRKGSMLLKREINNYSMIKHPFLPQFYGTITNSNSIIIEYIDGKELSKIEKLHLKAIDKYTIIFQLLSVINHLHENNFVYRDLRPKNIMIDKRKTLILIDFDRLINENNKDEHSCDLLSSYIAPEINLGKLTKKSDIYSIGMIMYFIMKGKNDIILDPQNLSNDLNDHPRLKKIIEKCIDENPDNRPSISQLISQLYSYIFKKNMILKRIDPNNMYEFGIFCIQRGQIEKAIQYLSISSDYNNQHAQFILGLMNYDGRHLKPDINKAIHYFTLGSNQNNSEAQFYLGIIFYEGKYIERNIEKSIYYFTLAANNHHIEASINLGIIYYNGIYTKRDINKTIEYFSFVSEQNYPEIQYQLGLIYLLEDKNIRDINKAIKYLSMASDHNHSMAQLYLGKIFIQNQYGQFYLNKSIFYFTLSANQNNPYAQCSLGCIYYTEEFHSQDINKSIYYMTLAANQNNVESQYNLGVIYYFGKYVSSDINKSIYYLTLASNNDIPSAHLLLGFIYINNKYISVDIDKAIYYFKLASDHNICDAHKNLGIIYYNGKYITRDINKSIYYFTLASNQNDIDSLYHLGYIYYQGEYINQDINKSIYYFSLAANQNDQNALVALGVIYYEGKYIPRNIDKSIYYLKLAANQNNSDSLFDIGCIYYEGLYITRDINKALYYFLNVI